MDRKYYRIMLTDIRGRNDLENFLEERRLKFLLIGGTWSTVWYIIPFDFIKKDIDSLKESLESYAKELKVTIEIVKGYSLVSTFNKELEEKYRTEVKKIDCMLKDIAGQISDWNKLGGVRSESERTQVLNNLKEVDRELDIIWNEVRYFTSDFTDECEKRMDKLRMYETYIRGMKTIH